MVPLSADTPLHIEQMQGEAFYADVEMMRDAIRRHGSFKRLSDRQWRDVLGVLKVQGDRLDRDDLRRMAATLNVTDLLERTFDEAS